MKLTFLSPEGSSFLLELPPSMTLADVRALVEADASIPAADQRWLVGGREVKASAGHKRLDETGWGEEVVVQLGRAAGEQQQQQPQQQASATSSVPSSSSSGASAPPPGLSPAQYAQMENYRRMMLAQAEEQELIDKLEANPWDIESQKKIEEIIQQKAVAQSYDDAMEYNPESFASVTMLYIDVEVNGHKVKAFVDSGAQSTIISPECAEACGIMRLLDKRFHGEARGVGTAKILGRIHQAQIKLADLHLPVAFTVLEGKDVDLLFGLDMLKRYRAAIDLGEGGGCLRIQGREVPFLSEHELPPKARREVWVDDAGGKKPEVQPANPSVPPTAVSSTSSAIGGMAGSFPGGGRVLAPSTPTPSTGPSSSPAPASEPPAAAASEQETKVQALVSLGASRAQAVQLLELSGGDLDVAAGHLF